MSDLATTLSRVALYARVSTEEQREGQTIDSQITELERFAKDRQWLVVGTYKDEGWSGAVLARPDLDRLRDDASKGLFTVVLINDVDRLARDVSHLGIIKRDLERRGIQVVFRKLPAEKSPTYNLMVNILGSFAEFERELIADRTRRGRRHKVEARQQYLGGNSSYGYRYVPKDKAAGKEGHLEIVPEEAAVVKQMFDWVDKEGLSATKVTDRLSEMSILPRRGGMRWGKSSVLRILRNEMYAGVWYYNKHEGCEPANPSRMHKYRKSLKGSLRKRPKSEWIPVILPQELVIVDRSQWERVQQQINRNATFSPRNSRHQYFLKGLIQCGGCGARYVGDPCHGKFYYRCLARCKRHPTIREEVIDTAVWDAIKEAILNPRLIADQVAKLSKRQAETAERIETEAEDTRQALNEIEAEEARIIEAYRKGIITAAQLGRELEQINIRKSSLEMRSESLTGDDASPSPSLIRRSISEFCEAAAARLESFNFEERQRFLRLVVENIVYEGNQVRIRGIVPVAVGGASTLENEVVQEEAPPILASRIADMAAHNRGLNAGRIEDIMVYRRDPNPVEFPFEISRLIPQALTIYEQVDLEWVREKVRKHPLITLEQLADLIHKRFGVKPSVTHVERILQRADISRIPGSRAKQAPTL